MDKLVEFAKKNLVVFEGASSMATIYQSYDRFKEASKSSDLKRVIWLLPLDKSEGKEVQDQLSTFIPFRPRVNGEIISTWLSPIGLIVLQRSDMDGLDLRDVEETGGWMIPTHDWLYKAWGSGKLLRVPSNSVMEKVSWNTSWAKEARRIEDLAREEAQVKSQKKLLTDVGAPVTDETLTLAKEVMGFDVYYDYSDDHKFCIQYRAYERELRKRLKDAGIESILDNYISSVVNRKKEL